MLIRAITPKLKLLAAKFPIIAINGPRQSGKTTLAKMTFPGYSYISLENMDNRQFALKDPRGFLLQHNRHVIIDEAQHAPELLTYIQSLVDEQPLNGRYIITGSQQFNLSHKISQSLAGRAVYLRLLPFSVSELLQKEPMRPEAFPLPPAQLKSRLNLSELLFSGFYPRIYTEKLAPADFLSSYISTYVERDVRDVLNVGDLMTFQNFVQLCAGRSGQILNLSALASDCGISQPTARQWLSVLEASSLAFTLRPYYKNFSKRIVKSPKLYFIDTGLMCHLLKIRKPEDVPLHPLYGSIFETYAVAELYKAFCHTGEIPPLYFWRDKTGHEVDLLADLGNHLSAVEIKSGKTIDSEFFNNLKYLAGISKIKTTQTLVYGGNESGTRQDINIRTWQELS